MNKPKFRAWDKKNNKMRKIETISLLTNSIECELEPSDNPTDYHGVLCVPLPASDYILMRYTGLKDKNGVEIYEGDVIASQNKNRKNWKISHHEIVWHDAGFVGKQICSSSFIGIDYWTRGKNGYVVIGNIHENPELLNEVE